VQAGTVSAISLSQSNISLSVGSNQSVTISGGTGTYSISSNSNTSVVSTSLSGSSLTVSGVAAGTATITVCDASNNCGTLTVTVSSSSTSTSGLTFGQSNVSLAPTNSQIVSISGGNGVYSISSNSNSSAVSVGMSSGGVTVYAVAAGSATIKICDSASVCGYLYVTVTGSTTSTQAVAFSVTNPTLTVGQNLNVALTGSAGAPSYFISSNANADIVQATTNGGTTLSLSGVSVGTDSITICATGGSGCAAISVTVTGPTVATTTTTTATVTPVTTVTTPTVQPTVSVVANTALLAEVQTLQSALTQILTQVQSMETEINQLTAQISAGSGSTVSTSIVANTSSGTSSNFTELLTLGTQDAQVTALQNRLISLGFLSGSATGYYGTMTQQAVMKYQTAHGITATGSVGPSTRAALNAGN
jgi:hypothetical protein